jgi:hypothetical protein
MNVSIFQSSKFKYKPLFLFLIILFFAVSLFSQRLNHKFSSEQDFKPRNYLLKSDTINVLAVMVQFQVDKDTLTTGNGTFDLSSKYRSSMLYNGQVIKIDTSVDAPPHNKDYFYQHLVFLKNYYEKVSDKKVIINFTIPDKIYTLPNQMKAYSPPKGNDYSKLTSFISDSWRVVDSVSPEIDFSKYQCFFIFHAGTGKDVDLASLYGYDPSPYDLPSIYLNLKAMQKYLDGSYPGVPVNKGKFFIQNSAIIPENEYRDLISITGPIQLQLSINGIVVSSLGSYLGLPDLFNTKTGSTAIGRFGLMDGQAIFSYSGVFPPEPSAWEKIYLGWVKPEIIAGNVNITAYAHRTDGADNSNYKIYKIPINSREYFLAECKFRDPANNGQKFKLWSNGSQFDFYLPKDTESLFDQFGNINGIKGVVTDVEDFDWSLPGGLMDRKQNVLNGGILIWHIDENVIDAKITTNSINDDPNHRGVDLEEADGSQDIGQSYGTLSSGLGSENGWGFDFWYDDITPSLGRSEVRPIYKNIFSPTSQPNSLAYDYSNSHITISDFSKLNPIMTFKVKIGDESIQLLTGFPKKINKPIVQRPEILAADLDGNNQDELIFKVQNELYCFNNGQSVTPDSTGKILDDVFNFAISDWNNNKRSQIVCDQLYGKTDLPQGAHCINFYEQRIGSIQYIYSVIRKDILDKSQSFLVTYLEDNVNHILMVTRSSGYYDDLRYITPNNLNIRNGNLFDNKDSVYSIITVDKTSDRPFNRFVVSDKTVKDSTGSQWQFSKYYNQKQAVGGDFNGDGNADCALLTYDREHGEVNLLIFDKLSSKLNTKKILSNICDNCWNNVSNPAVGDIDNDGKQDIVFTFSDKLYAYNFNGVILPNFPIMINSSNPIVTPIIGDIDGDKKNEILAISKEGKIFAFNGQGKSANGFPISIGISAATTPTFFNSNGNIGLAVISSDGYLNAWKMNGSYDANHLPWMCDNANSRRTSYANEVLSRTAGNAELMPKSKTYNWPNPVYGASTKIRFYLNESANVNIKIFDLSGEKVDELSVAGVGGIDNEVEWNVKKIQSGVYLARIEANSSGGNSIAVIRIAIVK